MKGQQPSRDGLLHRIDLAEPCSAPHLPDLCPVPCLQQRQSGYTLHSETEETQENQEQELLSQLASLTISLSTFGNSHPTLFIFWLLEIQITRLLKASSLLLVTGLASVARPGHSLSYLRVKHLN